MLKISNLSFGICLFAYFISPPIASATTTNPVPYEITVSASIGESRLTLFGYTSPNALVQLDGQRVSEEVIAGQNGYFFFDRIFLPKPTVHLRGGRMDSSEVGYPELCLTSIDTQSRISFPNCLPPLPTGPFDITVGPVLLSPTLSLSKGSFLPREQIMAEGLTIPNTEVNIFLANDAAGKKLYISKFLNLFNSRVYAYSLPQYKTKADANGFFEFNLPTIKRSNWKIFVGALYQGSLTPKSNTLNFKIQSWLDWLWLILTNLFGAFLRLTKPYWWWFIVLVELFIAVLLFRERAKDKKASC